MYTILDCGSPPVVPVKLYTPKDIAGIFVLYRLYILGWPILYSQNFKISLHIWSPPNFFTGNKTSILSKFEDNIPIGRVCSKTCNIKNIFEKSGILRVVLN